MTGYHNKNTPATHRRACAKTTPQRARPAAVRHFTYNYQTEPTARFSSLALQQRSQPSVPSVGTAVRTLLKPPNHAS